MFGRGFVSSESSDPSLDGRTSVLLVEEVRRRRLPIRGHEEEG